jgi:cysteinyl-tRNA synthetase
VLRFQMLMSNYRQPINWSAAKSAEIEDELFAWTATLIYSDAESDGYHRATRQEPPEPSPEIIDALLDDLNTAEAIAVLRANYRLAKNGGYKEKRQFLMDCQFLGILRHDKLWVHLRGTLGKNTRGLPMPHDLARKLRISVANSLPNLRREAQAALALLGLSAEIAPDGNVTLIPLSQEAKDTEKHIEELITKRNHARAKKDFAESDRIRNQLSAMGVTLRDFKDPVTGEMKTEIAR